MSKAILVLDDMPKDCMDCDLNYDMFTCLFLSGDESSTIGMNEKRLENCPLKEPPKKKGTSASAIIPMMNKTGKSADECLAYTEGFNDCLKEIFGKEN